MNNRVLILGSGLAGVGKTTHLKALAALIPDSLYLNKDDINLELGQEFDANSDYYKRTISPLTYKVMMKRANAALVEGRVVICDGYFGDKLTSSPVFEQFQDGEFLTKVIYFHCSANKQQQRLEKRGVSLSRVVTEKKPIKKIIILDTGGVLQPDTEFGASNQEELAKLTHLPEEKLNQGQDYHSLNGGERPLCEALKKLSQPAPIQIKPSVKQLQKASKQGIKLYPGVSEMIRDLYKAGYQVVLLANSSDLGLLVHTRELLAVGDLSCVKVYGPAELYLHKPDLKIFLHVCKEEQVTPEECWFVDDRKKNRQAAQSLGMSVVAFDRPAKMDQAANAINICRDEFLRLGILRRNDFVFPSNFNRGKYPSLLGVVNHKVVRYQPSDQRYVEVDEPNEDGNQRKRCVYESRLSSLIVEKGRQYWKSGYQAINQLFLADFDLKSDPERVNSYKAYFDKIGSSLKKEGLIADKSSYDVQELRVALVKLFVDDFNLTHVSQFYYNVWLFTYGPEPLEPFVFLTDLLKQSQHVLNNPSYQAAQSIRLLQLFPDMAHNVEDRRHAYYIAQPWLTCGVPQLRGRKSRINAPKPADAKTYGIIRDNDACAADFASPPHFAAKTFFSPSREHPIAKEFQSNAAPIIGGSSGTLGRNILMLAPLIQAGLLSQVQLKNYVMGFLADLIYRGHHSYEEVAVVADQVLFPLKPWLDPLRDPTSFYEQLLTEEFLVSGIYRQFLVDREGFFNIPIAEMKEMSSKTKSISEEIKPDMRKKEKAPQSSSWSWGKKALLTGVGFGALFVGYRLSTRGTSVSSGSTPNLTLRPKL